MRIPWALAAHELIPLSRCASGVSQGAAETQDVSRRLKLGVEADGLKQLLPASAMFLLGLVYPGTALRESFSETNYSNAVSDSSVVALVRPAGGAIELPGYGRVIIPAGSFEAAESVTVAITDVPSTPIWLDQYGWIAEGKTPYLSFVFRISANHRPARGYEVEIILPRSYVETIQENFPPKVFKEDTCGGRMETLICYDELSSELDLKAGVIRARVSPDNWGSGTSLEDILIVGCCEPNL